MKLDIKGFTIHVEITMFFKVKPWTKIPKKTQKIQFGPLRSPCEHCVASRIPSSAATPAPPRRKRSFRGPFFGGKWTISCHLEMENGLVN